MLLHCRGRGETGNEDRLAGRGRGDHVDAGACGRHGRDDSRYRLAHGLSTVKTDSQLTAIAERQAKAMAASGIMDHSVAGSFTARISGARTGMAAENIAAGTKTWAETFHMWQTSPGHNANLLQSKADIVGVAVARNEQTRYKTYWAMVI